MNKSINKIQIILMLCIAHKVGAAEVLRVNLTTLSSTLHELQKKLTKERFSQRVPARDELQEKLEERKRKIELAQAQRQARALQKNEEQKKSLSATLDEMPTAWKDTLARLDKQSLRFPYARFTQANYSAEGWYDAFMQEMGLFGPEQYYPYPSGGYIFFTHQDRLKNREKVYDLDSVLNLKKYLESLSGNEKKKIKAQLKEIKKAVVNQYKIHLMPKNKTDLMIILEQFFTALKNNPALNDAVIDFKVKSKLNFLNDPNAFKQELIEKYGQEKVMPIIVMYPKEGRQYAQFVLDAVYTLFKDMKGLGLTPRFNFKITDLIYYAQGNADDKLYPNFVQFFTADKVLFRPDFLSKKNPNENFPLKNPATTID